MTREYDRNYVSFRFWMFALFITALPCIGWIMIIIWAFLGDNSSRKNYFRAVIAWMVILTLLWGSVFLVGLWPKVEMQLHQWFQQMK
jgi:hypothetical protein